MADNNYEKLADLIKDIEVCMLTTVEDTAQGSLRSRPMRSHIEKNDFNGTLWFFTSADSGKVEEVEKDHHVNLSYADPKSQTYVSVSGVAQLSRDRAKMEELWTPFYKAWFPDGLDDPKVALLRVEADQAEYWDSPSSAVVHLFGAIKAIATGKPAQGGENEKLDL